MKLTKHALTIPVGEPLNLKVMKIMKLKLFIMLIVTLALLAVASHAQTTSNKFTEREVTFAGGGGLQLHGTLVLPSGTKAKVGAVLLLPGSGPCDRNGNQPLQKFVHALAT